MASCRFALALFLITGAQAVPVTRSSGGEPKPHTIKCCVCGEGDKWNLHPADVRSLCWYFTGHLHCAEKCDTVHIPTKQCKKSNANIARGYVEATPEGNGYDEGAWARAAKADADARALAATAAAEEEARKAEEEARKAKKEAKARVKQVLSSRERERNQPWEDQVKPLVAPAGQCRVSFMNTISGCEVERCFPMGSRVNEYTTVAWGMSGLQEQITQMALMTRIGDFKFERDVAGDIVDAFADASTTEGIIREAFHIMVDKCANNAECLDHRTKRITARVQGVVDEINGERRRDRAWNLPKVPADVPDERVNEIAGSLLDDSDSLLTEKGPYALAIFAQDIKVESDNSACDLSYVGDALRIGNQLLRKFIEDTARDAK